MENTPTQRPPADSPSTNEKPPMKKSRASIILSIVSAIFLVLTAVGIFLMRKYLKDPEILRQMIGEHYLIGAICMILISAIQVIVALVPGELVEIAAGYIFGGLWGSLLCLAGIVLGSCITILLVRRFGRKFVYVFYPKEKLDALPILRSPKKRNILTFIIFAIPGTPKDLFTYAIGLTDMSIPLYILLTTVARYPSVIGSTLTGNAAGEQNYVLTIVFMAITAAISGIGLVAYNTFIKRHQEKEAIAENVSVETAENLPKDDHDTDSGTIPPQENDIQCDPE